MRKAEYDDLIEQQPRAALQYLDEDDGEIIHVGSSFELDQRLQDDPPYYVPTSLPPIGSSMMHAFDVERDPSVISAWQQIDRRCNNAIEHANEHDCITCGQRIKKWDKRKPNCLECQRAGMVREGYQPANQEFELEDSTDISPLSSEPVFGQVTPPKSRLPALDHPQDKTKKADADRWASYSTLPQSLDRVQAPNYSPSTGWWLEDENRWGSHTSLPVTLSPSKHFETNYPPIYGSQHWTDPSQPTPNATFVELNKPTFRNHPTRWSSVQDVHSSYHLPENQASTWNQDPFDVASTLHRSKSDAPLRAIEPKPLSSSGFDFPFDSHLRLDQPISAPASKPLDSTNKSSSPTFQKETEPAPVMTSTVQVETPRKQQDEHKPLLELFEAQLAELRTPVANVQQRHTDGEMASELLIKAIGLMTEGLSLMKQAVDHMEVNNGEQVASNANNSKSSAVSGPPVPGKHALKDGLHSSTWRDSGKPSDPKSKKKVRVDAPSLLRASGISPYIVKPRETARATEPARASPITMASKTEKRRQIDECETQLKEIGFTASESAIAADESDGDLHKAIDILEEDRKVWDAAAKRPKVGAVPGRWDDELYG